MLSPLVEPLEAGVSVVVPVFKSSETLPLLVTEVSRVLDGTQYEILLVDDGSPPDTWEVVEALSRAYPAVRGIRLSRNFGQHSALLAGVRSAQFTVTVTIDDDLQNPPSEMPKLIDRLVEGDLDVVYGVTDDPNQHWSRKIAGSLTRWALKSGLGVRNAPDISSYRAFRTSIRSAFDDELGTNVSLDALLTWGAQWYGSVQVRHDPRRVGRSNYSFGRLLKFALDTTTGYSAAPLQVASVLGLITACFGAVVLIVVVLRPLVTGQSVPGFPFLASTIAIFAGAQLLTLGVIGEYLSRMHFRVMRKPTYVIRERTASANDDPL